MKRFTIGLMILSLLSVWFFTGCSKDDDNPVSYVDNYEKAVVYKETLGTTHTGDYFPLVPYRKINFSGHMKADVQIQIPGIGTEEETVDEDIYGAQLVLEQTQVALPGGSLSLYPIVDTMDMTTDTTRFFMKGDTAVYIKAIKVADGEYLEVEDPVFVKNNLVVGDSWKSAPRVDVTKMMQAEMSEDESTVSNLTMNAEAKFYVAGEESIDLPVGTRMAVRLEQANDIVISGQMIEEGESANLNVDAKLAIVYHVIADTGVVHQDVTGQMNIAISYSGQTITVLMDIQQSELKLTYISTVYDLSPFPYDRNPLSKQAFSGRQTPEFQSVQEKKAWSLSHKIARCMIRQLTL